MSEKFNPANAQAFFTSKFWKDHVFVGNDMQKKKAETVFQRRSVQVSSVICLTRAELVKLAGEIHQRQAEFAKGGPHSKYTSKLVVDMWTRGGTKPRDQQTASHKKSVFKFAVRKQTSGTFAVHHFDG